MKIKCHDCSKSIEAKTNGEIPHARASCAAGCSEAKLRTTQWHEGTSKGGTSGNDSDKKKSKEREKGRKGKGSADGRSIRRDDADTFQGRGWPDSRVSYPWFLPSLSRSLVSPSPWRPYTTI